MNKKYINKLIGALMLSVSSLSFAGTADLTADGTIVTACTWGATDYSASFGTVASYSQPTVAVAVGLTCDNLLPYEIRVASDVSTSTTSNGENVGVRVFSDSGYTTQVTTATGIAKVGNGLLQSQTIYLKASAYDGTSFTNFQKTGTLAGTVVLRAYF